MYILFSVHCLSQCRVAVLFLFYIYIFTLLLILRAAWTWLSASVRMLRKRDGEHGGQCVRKPRPHTEPVNIFACLSPPYPTTNIDDSSRFRPHSIALFFHSYLLPAVFAVAAHILIIAHTDRRTQFLL